MTTQHRPYVPGRDPDRRKRPDIWVKVLHFITGSVYILFVLFAILLLIQSGNPIQQDNDASPGDRLVYFMTSKDAGFMQYFFAIMILGLVVSIAGIFINAKRTRRKYDENHLSVMGLGIISILGMILYLLFV